VCDTPDSGLVADLDAEQRSRYYRWWQKCLLLKRCSYGLAAILLACWLSMIGQTPIFPVRQSDLAVSDP